jgi:hypothetical protein
VSARFTAKVNKGMLYVYDDDFVLDALLKITGDWPSDEIKLRYGQQVADALNALPPTIPTREECEVDIPPRQAGKHE